MRSPATRKRSIAAMSSLDPSHQHAMPGFLIPTPAAAAAAAPPPPAAAAAPAPPTPGVSLAPAAPAQTCTRTLLGDVMAICTEAQAAAFPGVSMPVKVAASTRDGADYQNNSALILFNAFKRMSQGHSPSERADLFHDTAARVYRLDI